MTRAPGTSRCRPAPGAAGRSGASSAAARTGTARPACGATSRAPPAARTGPSPPGTGQAGRGARSARTTTAVTRSPSSTASSPPWIPAPGGKPLPSAVRRSAPRPSYQQKLAWALEDNPALLTGDGHLAPLRAIPRFIEMLRRRGRRRRSSARPAAAAAAWCASTSRWTASGSAGPASRTPAPSRAHAAEPSASPSPATGRAGLSARTASSPPRRTWRPAPAAGAVRRVERRTADGPLVLPVPFPPVLSCSACGQTAPCGISRATGKPWCPPCQRRRAACSACGRHEAIASGTLDSPLCAGCTPPPPWARLPCLQRPGSSQSRPVRPLHHQRPAGRADGP